MSVSKSITMDDLMATSELVPLVAGDTLEGEVCSVKPHEVWIDLGARGVGVVMRRELGRGQAVNIGDKVTVSVIDPEMEGGHALLSIRRAAKERGWSQLIKLMESQDSVEVAPYDANRGGLLVEFEGVRGFLPVSQLAAVHYPRVGSSDKDEILQKLNRLVNQPLKLKVLDVSRRDNKLIFSEKEAVKDDLAEHFAKLKIGDVVEGVVTGVIDFGAFVNIGGVEGLIHISEISWERVEDPRDYLKAGDKIKAKIIAIENDRLSLSLKQTTEDPWLEQVKGLKSGDEVEGKITRITPFGAFVQIGPSVEALVHISEMGAEKDNPDPEKVFQLNEKKRFKILEVDTDARKIALSLNTSKKK